MAQVFYNNVAGLLNGTHSAVATSLTLQAGHNFPDPGANYYLATLILLDSSARETAWEIVSVTNVATNTLTVTRAQEGTTGLEWAGNTRIEVRLTAGTATSLAPLSSPALTGTPTAPTATQGDNDTSIATTAFVNAEIAADAAPIAHVGAGATAHANVVAAGAAGFMTGADKTKLDGVATGATANTGTVTSVALSLPAEFTVSGSPVTTTGTLTATKASQTANQVFASPNGSSGAPVFRSLVAADVPSLSYQPLDTDLTAIAGLSSADSNFIVGSATGWVAESGATARTSLGLGTAATMTGPSGTIVGTTDAQTLSAKTITALKETKTTSSSYNFDLAAGNYFTHTASANNLTVSNVPASGTVASFIIELTNGGAYTFSFWSGVKWAGGTVPTLTASGVDILGFYTHDGGTTWRGLLLARDSK
jgi:hypothetical protein